MKIYIYNCSNTYNYGSMMMGENFIHYFNKVTGSSNDYYVETGDEINIERLRTATQCSNIYPAVFNSLFIKEINKSDYLFSLLKFKKIVSDFVRNIDLVVVLGGDDFTEDYGWKAPLIYAAQFNFLRREGVKVVMLGQTMGPFHSFRVPIMKRLLGKIDKIFPRDQLTYQYLKNLGLKNLTLMDDLALLPLTRQKIKKKSGNYIILCPSELIYRYSKDGNRESWIEYNLFMLDTVMNQYPDRKLILLAHVLKPPHVDDRIIVKELYNLRKDQYKDRIIAIKKELLPFEVRNIIHQSLFVISARMHAVISSFQCGTPAIAISYSSKFWGIIGERYGLEEYIIDVRYLDYSEMRQKFVQLLDGIEEDGAKILERIETKNELVKQSIQFALEEIRDL